MIIECNGVNIEESLKKRMHLNLKKPWSEVKELLKENDISLSDEDLELSPGKDEEFLIRLGRKMGKSPEDVKAYIESVSSNAAKSG
jgi:hypothetical protein